MYTRSLMLITIILISLSFPEAASASDMCSGDNEVQPLVGEPGPGTNKCPHAHSNLDNCCSDMTLRHCSGALALFISNDPSMRIIAMQFSLKIELPVDTLLRTKHATNLFRPPITTA